MKWKRGRCNRCRASSLLSQVYAGVGIRSTPTLCATLVFHYANSLRMRCIYTRNICINRDANMRCLLCLSTRLAALRLAARRR